ncbi:roadblock/LC7 domain-containing protein [Streptomyces indonesiensis]
MLSRDGATVSASGGLSRHEAEHLATVASGFHGIAASAGRRGRGGPSRRTMIEMAAGTLFVAVLADGACLAVLGTAGAELPRSPRRRPGSWTWLTGGGAAHGPVGGSAGCAGVPATALGRSFRDDYGEGMR